MNWLDFSARIIEALAWPATVTVLAIVFRSSVKSILSSINARLSRLSKISAAGMTMDFSTEVEQARLAVEEVVLPANKKSGSATGTSSTWGQLTGSNATDARDFDRMLKLADVSPRGAVLEAFIVLEEAIYEASGARASDAPSRHRPVISALRDLDLTSDVRDIIKRLVSLRNEAAHVRDFQITSEAAVDYVNTVEQLAYYLRGQFPSA